MTIDLFIIGTPGIDTVEKSENDFSNFIPRSPEYQNLYGFYILRGNKPLDAAIQVMETYLQNKKE